MPSIVWLSVSMNVSCYCESDSTVCNYSKCFVFLVCEAFYSHSFETHKVSEIKLNSLRPYAYSYMEKTGYSNQIDILPSLLCFFLILKHLNLRNNMSNNLIILRLVLKLLHCILPYPVPPTECLSQNLAACSRSIWF